MKQKFDVMGMSCSACSSHVDGCVRKLKGVSSVEVNLLSNSMNVEYDENTVNPDAIISAVQSAGYDACLPGEKNETTAIKDDSKPIKKRIILFKLEEKTAALNGSSNPNFEYIKMLFIFILLQIIDTR